MKPLKSKADIRAEIEAQIASYTQQGGEVQAHEVGDTGHPTNTPLPASPHIESNPQSRTLVLDEVRAIEARRTKTKVMPSTNRVKRQRKKLITDDFGEPLRWVWVEE